MKTTKIITTRYRKLTTRLLKFYKCEVKQFNKILEIN